MTYKIVVPISGGKDSQSCLKLALKEYKPSEVLGLFCDTKFEHPLTYQHIRDIQSMYGVTVETITGGSVVEKILKYKHFPTDKMRFCTDELKIRESKLFYKLLAEKQGGFEVWYGMRSDESHQRAKRYSHVANNEVYLPHEVQRKFPKYLGKMGVRFKLPIIDWSKEEVFDYLDGEQNPLYAEGFDRVGCFPCMAGGDKWKAKSFEFDETGAKHYKMMKDLEGVTGYPVYTSQAGRFNEMQGDMFKGCAICAI